MHQKGRLESTLTQKEHYWLPRDLPAGTIVYKIQPSHRFQTHTGEMVKDEEGHTFQLPCDARVKWEEVSNQQPPLCA